VGFGVDNYINFLFNTSIGLVYNNVNILFKY